MPLSSPRSTRLAAGRLSRPLPAFAIAACLALALLGGCKKGDGDAQAKDADKGPDAIPVEVATVARRPIAASYSGTAPLEARGESQVVAKTSGVALQVLAQEGQAVRAGQVLVRIDRARPALQAAQAEAQVRKLEANYSRARTLAARGWHKLEVHRTNCLFRLRRSSVWRRYLVRDDSTRHAERGLH